MTRILVTLECDTFDTDALRALPALADTESLELTGLFVEDEDLLRAARLPGVSEISVATGRRTAISAERLRAELSAQVNKARVQFETSTRRANLKASFRVVRGQVVDAVAEAARDSDVVVVTRSLKAPGLRARRGHAYRSIVRETPNLLIVNEPWSSGVSVVALCESADADCARTLRAARAIADAEGLDLVVAKAKAGDAKTMADVDRMLALDEWTEEAIAELCEREDARLLVLAPTPRLDWRELLVNLADRLPCSLLTLDGAKP